MFIFKKILGALLAPETIIFILLTFGLLQLVLAGRSKRRGLIWLSLGTFCYYLFTTAPFVNILLDPLENQYQPLVQWQDLHNVQYIVVLSGDIRMTGYAPATSQLGESTAFRVVEGIRLYHLLSARPVLIMSGGNDIPSGELMVAFARSLGVPAEKLLAETKSIDTYGNAWQVRQIIKEAPFLLVTSAVHMPRSVKIFQLLGMQPTPAPADFRWQDKFTGSSFLPQGRYLTNVRGAFHEYIGLAYLRLFPGRAGK